MAALSDSDREVLLRKLAAFTRVDARAFLAAPIILPNETFFPDPWEPTEPAQERLAQRLLAYAGLGTFVADVTFSQHAIDDNSMLPRTVVDLAGVQGNVVFFTVTSVGRADDSALAFAHEAARAALLTRAPVGETYRDAPAPSLLTPDEDHTDALDASILGVTLGLGVLGARGSLTFRNLDRTLVSEHLQVAYGALSPEAAAYLLAVQLCVRDPAPDERNAVLQGVGDERRAEVEAELRTLEAEPLIAALGLPPRAEWPRPQSCPAEVVRPERTAPRPKKPKKRPRIAFRVPRHRLAAGLLCGLFIGLVGGAVGIAVNSGIVALASLLVGTLGGAWIGWRAEYDECSTCVRIVPASEARCPKCGATLVGRIRNREDRPRAEEEWERAERGRRRAAAADE